MPFDDYAHTRKLWDNSNFIPIYPVTGNLFNCIMRECQDNIEILRGINWISAPPHVAESAEYSVERKAQLHYADCFYSYFAKKDEGSDSAVVFPYKSLYDENGKIIEENKNKLVALYGESALRLIKYFDRAHIDARVIGCYFPDFDKAKKDIDTIERGGPASAVKEGLFKTRLSYLNIEEAVLDGHSVYNQTSFDFPVGVISKFHEANISLGGDLSFSVDPSIVIYSMYSYVPRRSPDRGATEYKLHIRTEDSQPALLYPSDVFSIRWARAQTANARSSLPDEPPSLDATSTTDPGAETDPTGTAEAERARDAHNIVQFQPRKSA